MGKIEFLSNFNVDLHAFGVDVQLFRDETWADGHVRPAHCAFVGLLSTQTRVTMIPLNPTNNFVYSKFSDGKQLPLQEMSHHRQNKALLKGKCYERPNAFNI